MVAVCHACGKAGSRRERIGRRDRCEGCGVDLHCCRQCRFYDPRACNACAEPQAERVLQKDRANFCEYFTPGAQPSGDGAATGAGRRSPPPGDARADLERLFRRR